MHEPINFIPFFFAAVVLAITPGPSNLYIMARTAAGGKPDGFASVLGTAAGGLVHVAISAIGLSALLAASAYAFTMVKILGAAYLIYLGLRTLLQAGAPRDHLALRSSGSKRAFMEGLFTETFNVKVALFFLAFIPQFINPESASAPQFLLLGLVCVVLNMMADFAVVLGTTRLMPLLDNSPRTGRFLNVGAGSILIGLGVYVALAQSKR